MVIRKYLFLLLFIPCCYLNQENNIELLIENLEIQKKNITIILVDKKLDSNLNQKIKFRQKLITLAHQINKYEPTQIIFDYLFSDYFIETKDFTYSININMPITSFFSLNDGGTIHNNNYLMFKKFGIPVNEFDASRLAIDFYEYYGAEFPYKEIVNTSKTICLGGIENNYSDEAVGILIYSKFRNYLFTHCPIAIMNNLLENEKIKIGFDFNKSMPVLMNFKNGTNIGVLPFEEKGFKKYLKINFISPQIISADDFLMGKIPVNKSSIFIVGDSNRLIKTVNGKELIYPVILASEIYTLIDMTSTLLRRRQCEEISILKLQLSEFKEWVKSFQQRYLDKSNN